jgi:NAD(P)-dependent dehydrogenase (short-subunit alcohol dehydrogenase family)
MQNAQALKGKIAVVAGATRGAGRGIACMLGEAGATVYCTGRTTRAVAASRSTAGGSPFELEHRRETIDDTAEMVTSYGGQGIAVQVDHSDAQQVERFFERVQRESGRLDILVNDIWGADDLAEWGVPLWELSLEKGFQMLQRALHTHIITSRYALPLMVAQKSGLVIEITDGDTAAYRGSFFYDLVKNAVIRIAFSQAEELRPHGVAAVGLTPGFLRSEAMLEHFGVTEANWQDGAKVEPHFIASETPYFVGRAAAALATDPDILQKSGKTFSSWGLSDEYHFTDIDGKTPHWGQYYAANVASKNP